MVAWTVLIGLILLIFAEGDFYNILLSFSFTRPHFAYYMNSLISPQICCVFLNRVKLLTGLIQPQYYS